MRPRKPNELHILDGTARADRGTKDLVKLEGDTAQVPVLVDFADEFDRERTYDLLCDWVVKVTGAAQIDGLLLSATVDQYEIYAKSKKDVQENGIMLPSAKGGEYVNPALYNMNTAMDKIIKLMKEFGMTPATRSQVKASDQMDKDPLDNIMQGPRRNELRPWHT